RGQIGGPGGDLPVLDDPEPAEAPVDGAAVRGLTALAADPDHLPRADLGDVLEIEAVLLPAVEGPAHRLLHILLLPDELAVGTRSALVPADQRIGERDRDLAVATPVGLQSDPHQLKRGGHRRNSIALRPAASIPQSWSMPPLVYSVRQWPNRRSASRAERPAPTSSRTRPSGRRRLAPSSPTGSGRSATGPVADTPRSARGSPSCTERIPRR